MVALTAKFARSRSKFFGFPNERAARTTALTKEDVESGRRGDAESRLCLPFDAKGFKPPTVVVEKEKDIPG